MYCPRCGRECLEGARFCGSCGEDMMAMSGQPSASAQSKPLDMTGLLYVLISLFIPGLGHICFGQTRKGLLILVVFFASLAAGMLLLFPLLISLVVWVYCLWDLIVNLRAI